MQEQFAEIPFFAAISIVIVVAVVQGLRDVINGSHDYSTGLLMTIQRWIAHPKQSTVGDLHDTVEAVHPMCASKLLKYVSERNGTYAVAATQIRTGSDMNKVIQKLDSVAANWYIIVSLLGMSHLNLMKMAYGNRDANSILSSCIESLHQTMKLTKEGMEIVNRFLEL